jgi:hypothetical protein
MKRPLETRDSGGRFHVRRGKDRTHKPMTGRCDRSYGGGHAGVPCEHAQRHATAPSPAPAPPCDRSRLSDHGVDERRNGLCGEARSDRHDRGLRVSRRPCPDLRPAAAGAASSSLTLRAERPLVLAHSRGVRARVSSGAMTATTSHATPDPGCRPAAILLRPRGEHPETRRASTRRRPLMQPSGAPLVPKSVHPLRVTTCLPVRRSVDVMVRGS